MINVSIICSSLKHLKKYKLVVKLSRWLYEELSIFNYKDSKLEKALSMKDIVVIKSVINRVEDKNIMNKCLYRYLEHFDIIKLMLENGANESEFIYESLNKAQYGIYPKSVRRTYQK